MRLCLSQCDVSECSCALCMSVFMVACVQISVDVRGGTDMFMYLCAHAHTSVYADLSIHECAFICTCVLSCMCLSVWISGCALISL